MQINSTAVLYYTINANLGTTLLIKMIFLQYKGLALADTFLVWKFCPLTTYMCIIGKNVANNLQTTKNVQYK